MQRTDLKYILLSAFTSLLYRGLELFTNLVHSTYLTYPSILFQIGIIMAVVPEILIQDALHYFRYESELKKEAKGGCLIGKIKLPNSAIGSAIELELCDIERNPLENKFYLYVTPFGRQKPYAKEGHFLVPESTKLQLIFKEGKYYVDYKYHPYLKPLIDKSYPIVGRQFFQS